MKKTYVISDYKYTVLVTNYSILVTQASTYFELGSYDSAVWYQSPWVIGFYGA